MTFRRSIQLLQSGFGRAYGWWVELDGVAIGELGDARMEEMFWDSYAASALSAETQSRFFDESLWMNLRFRFRNKVMGEYAANPLCWGGGIVNGRVQMRGLYLMPTSRLERLQVRLLESFVRGPQF